MNSQQGENDQNEEIEFDSNEIEDEGSDGGELADPTESLELSSDSLDNFGLLK